LAEPLHHTLPYPQFFGFYLSFIPTTPTAYPVFIGSCR
jgi:hypothetical protein